MFCENCLEQAGECICGRIKKANSERVITQPNQDTPPQRFKWKDNSVGRWKFGVCLWNCTHQIWEIHTFGHGDDASFDFNPWEVIGQVVGDAHELVFIDNDFKWIQGVAWET